MHPDLADSLNREIAEIRSLSSEAYAAVRKLQTQIARVISGATKKPLRQIIAKCQISIYAEGRELIFDAPSLEIALSILNLRSRSRELAKIASKLAIEKIIVRTKEVEDFFLVRDKLNLYEKGNKE